MLLQVSLCPRRRLAPEKRFVMDPVSGNLTADICYLEGVTRQAASV